MGEKKQLDEIRKNSSCLNDRILKYIEYGLTRLDIKFNFMMQEIYKNLRVDDFFEGTNPRSMAGGFIYLFVKIYGKNITLRDIQEIFLISDMSIRHSCLKLQKTKAIIEVFGIIPSTGQHSIYKKIRGLYLKPSMDTVEFENMPNGQKRDSCYYCKHKFYHKRYLCRVCKKEIFHLHGILEHFKKNKEHRKFKRKVRYEA